MLDGQSLSAKRPERQPTSVKPSAKHLERVQRAAADEAVPEVMEARKRAVWRHESFKARPDVKTG